MPSFAVLGHRLRPSVQERAFADTLTLPVLLPTIGREAPATRVMPDGWVVVVQPLRPPRVTPLPRARRLRPLLATALGVMLCALPTAELHGDESAGPVVTRAARQPMTQSAAESDAPPEGRPAPLPSAPVGGTARAAGPSISAAPTRPAATQAGTASGRVTAQSTADSTGWPEHEWRVAEAMRLRYRELYARRLVDWATWQAREVEALRARRRWEAALAGRGAGAGARTPA